MLKCPSVFKRPIDDSDKWNVYTLSKYLSKYEFGNSEATDEDLKKKSSQKTTPNVAKRKNSKDKTSAEQLGMLKTMRSNTDEKGSDLAVLIGKGFATPRITFHDTDEDKNGTGSCKKNTALSKHRRYNTKGNDPKVHKVTKTASQRNPMRNSMNEQKFGEKTKDQGNYFMNKKTKMGKKVTKKRPWSASDKTKQKKLLKKNEVVEPSQRVFEVERQLDKLFEVNLINNTKLSKTWRSEEGQEQSVKMSARQSPALKVIIGKGEPLAMKIPLPPPVLNLDQLIKSKQDWGSWDEIILTQAKHIKNLQEIWKIYYSHIQKVHAYLAWESRRDNSSNRSHKNSTLGGDGSAINYENDLVLQNKSKSDSYKVINTKKIKTFQSSDASKGNSISIQKALIGIPNNSNETDLNSTKSGKVATKIENEHKTKFLKIRSNNNLESTNEKVSFKLIEIKRLNLNL